MTETRIQVRYIRERLAQRELELYEQILRLSCDIAVLKTDLKVKNDQNKALCERLDQINRIVNPSVGSRYGYD